MTSISNYIQSLLEDYKDLRGRRRNSGRSEFWDIVVLTTADPAQQKAFEEQIEDKRARSELPVDLPIHVISDPPGPRVGNGGSTLTVLETLHSIYGGEIFCLKTLLIHAGGWSQRMPSSSALGKVFSVIPHGSPPLQMLDIKLALYWPFVKKMQPGFFVVCADDISVHNLGFDDSWEILGTGFTALAHPSPMALGRGHGVYVLANPREMDTSKHVVSMECIEVLQKPDDQRMIKQGALLEGQNHVFADGIQLDGNACYTDSCFYFGVDVMKKLLAFKHEVGDLQCEIDAYGDFLQALGKNSDASYIHNMSNVSHVTPNLLSTRRKVYELLRDCSINVLVLNASAYIHIGTTKELLHHMCRDQAFQSKLSLEKDVFNAWVRDCKVNGSPGESDKTSSMKVNRPDSVSPFACVVHSAMPCQSVIDADTYIEFCDFQIPVRISQQSIVSNCQVRTSETSESKMVVPPSTFLHSVPVQTASLGSTHYVTVVFGTEDDLKKSIMSHEVSRLPFMGADIGTYLKSCNLKEEDILPKDVLMFRNKRSGGVPSNGKENVLMEDVNANENDSDVSVSLWNLKLYPGRPTMTSSFEDALKARLGQATLKKEGMTLTLYSFADLIKAKDVNAMLDFRKQLNRRIKDAEKKV